MVKPKEAKGVVIISHQEIHPRWRRILGTARSMMDQANQANLELQEQEVRQGKRKRVIKPLQVSDGDQRRGVVASMLELDRSFALAVAGPVMLTPRGDGSFDDEETLALRLEGVNPGGPIHVRVVMDTDERIQQFDGAFSGRRVGRVYLTPNPSGLKKALKEVGNRGERRLRKVVALPLSGTSDLAGVVLNLARKTEQMEKKRRGSSIRRFELRDLRR